MSDLDLHRVRFAHESVHLRLVNWGKWVAGGRGVSSSAPMFREYRAPRSESADMCFAPRDPLEAMEVEKVVSRMPERPRDALRWFYVYSSRGMSLGAIIRALGTNRSGLSELIDAGRTMVRNLLDRSGKGGDDVRHPALA